MREVKGVKLGFSQPIEMRINEMVSGVRSDLGVKLFGDDFSVLVSKANEIEKVLSAIDGAADVTVEQVTGQPMLQVKVNQEQIARYGVTAQAVLLEERDAVRFERGFGLRLCDDRLGRPGEQHQCAERDE